MSNNRNVSPLSLDAPSSPASRISQVSLGSSDSLSSTGSFDRGDFKASLGSQSSPVSLDRGDFKASQSSQSSPVSFGRGDFKASLASPVSVVSSVSTSTSVASSIYYSVRQVVSEVLRADIITMRKAAKNNDIKLLNKVLNRNYTSTSGDIISGQEDNIRRLFNESGKKGLNAFHYAIWNGNAEFVSHVLDNWFKFIELNCKTGPASNIKEAKDCTPFELAKKKIALIKAKKPGNYSNDKTYCQLEKIEQRLLKAMAQNEEKASSVLNDEAKKELASKKVIEITYINSHINQIKELILEGDQIKLQQQLLILKTEILKSQLTQLGSVIERMLEIIDQVQTKHLTWKIKAEIFSFIKELALRNVDKVTLFVDQNAKITSSIHNFKELCKMNLQISRGVVDPQERFFVCQSFYALCVFEVLFKNQHDLVAPADDKKEEKKPHEGVRFVNNVVKVVKGDMEGTFDLLKQGFSMLEKYSKQEFSSLLVSLEAFNAILLKSNALEDDQIRSIFDLYRAAIQKQSQAIPNQDSGWLPLYILLEGIRNACLKYPSIREKALTFIGEQLKSEKHRKFKSSFGGFQKQCHFYISLRLLEIVVQMADLETVQESANRILQDFRVSNELKKSGIKSELELFLNKNIKELKGIIMIPSNVDHAWATLVHVLSEKIKKYHGDLIDSLNQYIKGGEDSKNEPVFDLPDTIENEIKVFVKREFAGEVKLKEELYLDCFRRSLVEECIKSRKLRLIACQIQNDETDLENKKQIKQDFEQKVEIKDEVRPRTVVVTPREIDPQKVLQEYINPRERENVTLEEKIALIGYLTEQKVTEKVIGKSVIMVMGNTGSGKSTTINQLNGNLLEEFTDRLGRKRIRIGNKNPHLQTDEVTSIGHTNASETLIPQIIPIMRDSKDRNNVFCDCPGFLENRGEIIDIANFANVREILNKAVSLRFLWCINHRSLSDKGHGVRSAINILIPLFGGKEGIKRHSSSIVIGITFCRGSEAENDFKTACNELIELASELGWEIDKNNIRRINVDPTRDSKSIDDDRNAMLDFILGCPEIKRQESKGQEVKKQEHKGEGDDFFAKYTVMTVDHYAVLTKITEELCGGNITGMMDAQEFDLLASQYRKLDALSAIKFEIIEKKLEEFRNVLWNKIGFWAKELAINASKPGSEHLNVKRLLESIKGAKVLDIFFKDDRITKLFEKCEQEVREKEEKQQRDEDNANFSEYKNKRNNFSTGLSFYLEDYPEHLLKVDYLKIEDKENCLAYLNQLKISMDERIKYLPEAERKSANLAVSTAEWLMNFYPKMTRLVFSRKANFYFRMTDALEKFIEEMNKEIKDLILNAYVQAKRKNLTRSFKSIIKNFNEAVPRILAQQAAELSRRSFVIDDNCNFMLGSGLDQYHQSLQQLLLDSAELDSTAGTTETKAMKDKLDTFFKEFQEKAKNHRIADLNDNIIKIFKGNDVIATCTQWLELYEAIIKDKVASFKMLHELERLDKNGKHIKHCQQLLKTRLYEDSKRLVKIELENNSPEKFLISKQIVEKLVSLKRMLNDFSEFSDFKVEDKKSEDKKIEYKSDASRRSSVAELGMDQSINEIKEMLENKKRQQVSFYNDCFKSKLLKVESVIQSLIMEDQKLQSSCLQAKSIDELLDIFSRVNLTKSDVAAYNADWASFQKWRQALGKDSHFDDLEKSQQYERERVLMSSLLIVSMQGLENLIESTFDQNRILQFSSLEPLSITKLEKVFPKDIIDKVKEIYTWSQKYNIEALSKLLIHREQTLFGKIRSHCTTRLSNKIFDVLKENASIETCGDWLKWYENTIQRDEIFLFKVLYELQILDTKKILIPSCLAKFQFWFNTHPINLCNKELQDNDSKNPLLPKEVLSKLKRLLKTLSVPYGSHEHKSEHRITTDFLKQIISDLGIENTIVVIEKSVKDIREQQAGVYKDQLETKLSKAEGAIYEMVKENKDVGSLLLRIRDAKDLFEQFNLNAEVKAYNAVWINFSKWKQSMGNDSLFDGLEKNLQHERERVLMTSLLIINMQVLGAQIESVFDESRVLQFSSLEPLTIPKLERVFSKDVINNVRKIYDWAEKHNAGSVLEILTRQEQMLFEKIRSYCTEQLSQKIYEILKESKPIETCSDWLKWYEYAIKKDERLFFKLLYELQILDVKGAFISSCLTQLNLRFNNQPIALCNVEFKDRNSTLPREVLSRLKGLLRILNDSYGAEEQKSEYCIGSAFLEDIKENLGLEQAIDAIEKIVKDAKEGQASFYIEQLEMKLSKAEGVIQTVIKQNKELRSQFLRMKETDMLFEQFSMDAEVKAYNATWINFLNVKKEKYSMDASFDSIEMNQRLEREKLFKNCILAASVQELKEEIESVVAKHHAELLSMRPIVIQKLRRVFSPHLIDNVVAVLKWGEENKSDNFTRSLKATERDLLEQIAKNVQLKSLRDNIELVCSKEDFASQEQLPDWLNELKRINITEYNRQIINLQRALEKYQEGDKIDVLFKLDRFEVLTSKYKNLKILKERLKAHFKVNDTPFVKAIVSNLVSLRESALAEVEKNLDAKAEMNRKAGQSEMVYINTTNIVSYLNMRRKLQSSDMAFEEDKKEEKESFEDKVMATLYKAIKTISSEIKSFNKEMQFETKGDFKRENMAMGLTFRESKHSSEDKILPLLESLALFIIKGEMITKAMIGKNFDKFRSHMQTVLEKIEAEQVDKIGASLLYYAGRSNFDGEAYDVLTNYPAFRRFYIQQFNEKASGINFDKALAELKCFPPEKMGRSKLEKAYSAFNEQYHRYLMRILAKPPAGENENYNYYAAINDSIVEDATKLASELESFVFQLSRKVDQAAQLIGCLFAYWTYKNAEENQFRYKEESSLLQPHATQLLSIFRLLGLDEETGMKNHLAQVKTGEGKSVSLGIIATFMAMMGYSVDVICYSDYLSRRDYDAFRDLFANFSVLGRVNYQTIDQLVFAELRNKNQLPDLQSLFHSYIEGKYPKEFKSEKPKNVLVIDEVDFFFGEKFYGALRGILHMLCSEQAKKLLLHIWEIRDSYANQQREIEELSEKLMSSDVVQDALSVYKNLRVFIKPMLIKMLINAKEFPEDKILHTCELVEKETKNSIGEKTIKREIGYRNEETDELSTNTVISFLTYFAAFHFEEKLKLKRFEIYNTIGAGLPMRCGEVLYSELPKGYQRILGLSGTLDNLCDSENSILTEYDIQRRSYVPSTFAKKQVKARAKTSTACCKDDEEYFASIKTEIEEVLQSERPILIIFNTLERLKAFRKNLEINAKGKISQLQVLEDKYDKSEKNAAIARAMQKGVVTLMTRTYGRGVDFICRVDSVNRAGGVHVILTFFPETISEEIQVLGRTGRQDYNGSYRKIYHADDLSSYTQKEGWANAVADEEIDKFLESCRKDLNKSRYNELIDKNINNLKRHQASLQMAKAITSLGMFSSSAQAQPVHASIQQTIQELNENIFIKTPAPTSASSPAKRTLPGSFQGLG